MTSNYRFKGFGGTMMPPVIKALIGINVVVFLLQTFFFSMFKLGDYSLGDLFYYYCALFPIGGDHSNFYIWQLITYQFMHGNLGHIFFNLLALWMFGIELEQMWGSRKFLIFYLLCGVGAGLVQLFISPLFASAAPTIGASGSIYGVLLAFGLTFPDRPIFMFPLFIPIPAKYFVLIFAGINLLLGFTSTGDGVAHFAHLGGAATGFLLLKIGDSSGIYRLFSKKRKQDIYDNYSAPEPKVYKPNWMNNEPEVKSNSQSKTIINGEEITQAKIDEILDKISASGYQSLTEREKHILFELSQKMK